MRHTLRAISQTHEIFPTMTDALVYLFRSKVRLASARLSQNSKSNLSSLRLPHPLPDPFSLCAFTFAGGRVIPSAARDLLLPFVAAVFRPARAMAASAHRSSQGQRDCFRHCNHQRLRHQFLVRNHPRDCAVRSRNN